MSIGLVALSRGSWLDAREVDVGGEAHLSRGEVVRAAGLQRPTNVLWLDETEIERRLEAQPWIRSATVSTALPWTIRVSIVERVPVAVTTDGGSRSLVAGDGTVLGAATSLRGLPRIELPPVLATTGGRPPAAGAASALGAMDPDLRAAVGRVIVGSDGTLDVRLRDGTDVRYGDADELARKARALAETLAWAHTSATSLSRISLLAPGSPAVTFAP
jgi:cell division protein FtsQ